MTRRTAVVVAVVAAVAMLVAVATVVVATRDDAAPRRVGSAALARERLADARGRAYAGTFGAVDDPVALRRTLRRSLHADAPRSARVPAAVRRCASRLRAAMPAASGRRGDDVVLLGAATFAGRPAVVVGIAEAGRLVAFVTDAASCSVVSAQSL